VRKYVCNGVGLGVKVRVVCGSIVFKDRGKVVV